MFHPITLIILVPLFAEFFLHTLADILNLRVLRDELPPAFKDVYDQERYQKSQEYLRVNTRFEWISSGTGLLCFLIFWFGKGFPFLDQWARSLHQGPILTGILFIGVLAIIKSLLSLPFKVYATFVIEERFGFNRATWRVFSLDMLKGALLGIALGVPLVAGILAFFQYAGAYAWLYCWIAVTLFMLGVTFVAPTWIMPIFNKFSPLEPGELRTAILSYARSIDFPLENIYVMDGSKRSGKSNAFFTGFGKHRRIVLFDTLIEQHTISELVAILAHEMGHYKKRHILKTMISGVIQAGFLLFLLSFFISYQGLFDAFLMSQKSIYGGVVFFAILYAPVDLMIGLFVKAWSRMNEREADRFAIETTRDPRSFSTALKKLSVHNLSNLLPHPFYVFLHYSHPPILERIKVIETG
ncbi:MAG: peptidase M48 [Desulfobacteraceae bacterium 4484_190.3]|nr:MAG: peptidase M48 [Desulfobacteraceae bacterium 4484_190.3]